MPQPEIWGQSLGAPVVQKWGHNPLIHSWKVGGGAKPTSVLLGKRPVCEDTGAELDANLPGDFLVVRLEGILQMVDAKGKPERQTVASQMLPTGVGTRTLRRKISDIVRILDARISNEEENLAKEEAGIRLQIKGALDAVANRAAEREQARDMAEKKFGADLIDQRARLGVDLAEAREAEHKANVWLSQAEVAFTNAASKESVQRSEMVSELSQERGHLVKALDEQRERHAMSMNVQQRKLAAAESLLARAKQEFEREQSRLQAKEDAVHEEVKALEAGAKVAASASIRLSDTLAYDKASMNHEILKQEELGKIRDGLDKRLKTLESLRANLERALLPPIPAHGSAPRMLTIYVMTDVPLASLPEALDNGLHHEVMSLVIRAASASGKDTHDLGRQLVACGWKAQGVDQFASLCISILPSSDGGELYAPLVVAERVRGKFWRAALESRIMNGKSHVMDLRIVHDLPTKQASFQEEMRGAARVELSINMDYGKVEKDAASFKARLVDEVANALEIAPEQCEVVSLHRGSVIATLSIAGSEDASASMLADELCAQAKDGESKLRRGALGSLVTGAKAVRGESVGDHVDVEDGRSEAENDVMESGTGGQEEIRVEEKGPMDVKKSPMDVGKSPKDVEKSQDLGRLVTPGEIVQMIRSEGYDERTASSVAALYQQRPLAPSAGEVMSSIVPLAVPPSFSPPKEGRLQSKAPSRSRVLLGSEDDLEQFEKDVAAWHDARNAPDSLVKDEDEERTRDPTPRDPTPRDPTPRDPTPREELAPVDEADEAIEDEAQAQPEKKQRPSKDRMTVAAVKALLKAKNRRPDADLVCQVSGREFSTKELARERFVDLLIVPSWGMFICRDGLQSLRRRGVIGMMAIKLEKPQLEMDDNGQLIGVTFDAEGNPTGTDATLVPPGWSRVLNTSGAVVLEQPVNLPAEALMANDNARPKRSPDFVSNVTTRIGDRVLAALCADAGIPLDVAFRGDAGETAADAGADQTTDEAAKGKEDADEMVANAHYVFGQASLEATLWLRRDAETLGLAREGREHWVFCEAMDALLHGRLHPDRDEMSPRSAMRDAYDTTISRIKKAGMQFFQEGCAGCGPPNAAPPPPGCIAPLGPGALRLLPVVCAASSQVFAPKGCGQGGRIEVEGTVVTWAGQDMKPNTAYSAMTETCIDATKSANGVDEAIPVHIFEVTVDGDPYAFSIGVLAGSTAGLKAGLDTWFPENSLRLEYDGAVRGKGMFGEMSKKGPKVAKRLPQDPSRAVLQGDRVAVVLDLVGKQIGWLINGSVQAVLGGLPLGHHEAADLRFVVSTRAGKLTVSSEWDVGETVQKMEWKTWVDRCTVKAWKPLDPMLHDLGPLPGRSMRAFSEFEVEATADYLAQEQDEIPFKAGDRVRLTGYSPFDDTLWMVGEHLGPSSDVKGRKGLVPINFFKNLDKKEGAPVTANGGMAGNGKSQGQAADADDKKKEDDVGAVRSMSNELGINNASTQSGAGSKNSSFSGSKKMLLGGEDGNSILAIAIYDYDAREDDEISFKKGDELIILGHAEEVLGEGESRGWAVARRRSDPPSVRGLVPETFVQHQRKTGKGFESEGKSLESSGGLHPSKDARDQREQLAIEKGALGSLVTGAKVAADRDEGDTNLSEKNQEQEGDLTGDKNSRDSNILEKGLAAESGDDYVADSEEPAVMISSKMLDKLPVMAEAAYDYEAVEYDELTLKAGRLVTILAMTHDDGWVVAIHDDIKGMAPLTHLKKAKLRGFVMTPEIEAKLPISVLAAFDFEAADGDELSFSARDSITILSQAADVGWVQARDAKGKEGLVPATHLEALGRHEAGGKPSGPEVPAVLPPAVPSVGGGLDIGREVVTASKSGIGREVVTASKSGALLSVEYTEAPLMADVVEEITLAVSAQENSTTRASNPADRFVGAPQFDTLPTDEESIIQALEIAARENDRNRVTNHTASRSSKQGSLPTADHVPVAPKGETETEVEESGLFVTPDMLPLEVVVSWDYDPVSSDELTLNVGDRVTLLEMTAEKGWIKSRLGTKVGLAPTTHLGR